MVYGRGELAERQAALLKGWTDDVTVVDAGEVAGLLPERLGLALTDNGLVAVDTFARTSVPGLYAAGDLAVAPQQVAVALGSGHLAGPW